MKESQSSVPLLIVLPQGHTRLRLGDTLTLVGSEEAVREVAERCDRGRA